MTTRHQHDDRSRCGRHPPAACRSAVRRRVGRARRRRRSAPPAGLAAVAMGGRPVPDGRSAPRRRRHDGRHQPEVRRPAAPHRDRRGDARHRSGTAVARCAGNRQDVGQRAPGRGDQWRLDPARPGHGRHDGGDAALRLELRPPADRRAEPRGARAGPRLPRDAAWGDRAGRGTHPHARGGAGRAGDRAVREGAPRAGARFGDRRGPWVQPHRHGQRPRPRGERTVERAPAPVQHGRPPAPGDAGGGDRDRQPPRRRAGGRARRSPTSRRPPTRSAGS